MHNKNEELARAPAHILLPLSPIFMFLADIKHSSYLVPILLCEFVKSYDHSTQFLFLLDSFDVVRFALKS
jgi:hypothetical protein